jgi:two-component system, LytTR family, response regulator LytT
MQALIIEDELPAAERLRFLLQKYRTPVYITAHLYSVEDAVHWLSQNNHPDILFLDIHLADGFCFDIFKKIEYKKPVIFTTAYDQYTLDAFKLFSIDYLLKPITEQSLFTALDKLETITSAGNTSNAYSEISRVLQQLERPRHKERFLARAGQKMFFVATEEIEYFRADDKVVYLVDKQGNKLLVDYTLDKLESLLYAGHFFRLNRRYIVRYSSIAQVKPYINSRLKLILKNGQKQEEVIISRERVQSFREWANG